MGRLPSSYIIILAKSIPGETENFSVILISQLPVEIIVIII